jgi:hypothetical protein
VTGYGLDDRGSIPCRGKRFSPLRSVQTDSGAHAVSYPMGAAGYFSGVKWPRRKTDYSPPSSAKVKNGGAIPPLPHMS